MMMHRMAPLEDPHPLLDDSGDDVCLTPPSPSKTPKMPKNISDGKSSLTQQKDGQKRMYSYMSPISSDADDIPEKPQRRDRAKLLKRQTMKSSHQELSKQRESIKKTQRCNDLNPAVSESEADDCDLEASQNKRARKEAKALPKDTDRECSNGITWKTKARQQQNNKQAHSNVSTDSDSEKFTKKAPTSRRANEKCKKSTEKIKRVERTSGRAKDGSTTEDENTKHSAAHEAKTSAEQIQRITHRPSESTSSDSDEDMEENRPVDGSSHKRVRNKAGHRNAVSIVCEVCGRSIRCQAVLERHMLSHTGEKPFECDECGKQYTSSSNLRIHQLSHSGKLDYVCNECGRKFTHLSYLKRHLLRHSGTKTHICKHCGKGFIQKYHLVRHILVHTRQASHVCDKCGMSFNRADYLKLHLRNVHLIESNAPKVKAEKPYKCETCRKSFASHTSLETHKRIHTGAMPYSCIVCSRQFKQSSHLYSHMFTHSSEKPHACNLCELKFTRKNYLRKHKERVHSGAGDAQSSRCLKSVA